MDPMKPVCDEPNRIELPIYGFEYHPEDDETFIYLGSEGLCYMVAKGYVDSGVLHRMMASVKDADNE